MQLSRVGLPVGVTWRLSVLWVRWEGSIFLRKAAAVDDEGDGDGLLGVLGVLLLLLLMPLGEAWPDSCEDLMFFCEVPSFLSLSRCTASRHFATMLLAVSATSRLGFLRIWLTVVPMEVARRLASVAVTPVLRSLRRAIRMEGAALALAALASSLPFLVIAALSMTVDDLVCCRWFCAAVP